MDRNYLIDLALSIAQDAADEWHTKEYLSGLETELSEIDAQEMPELHQKILAEIAAAKEDYVEGAKLRRYKTDILGAKSPNYDYHKRCTFKHRATSYVLATEVYLADPDEMNYNAMKVSEERFYMALSQLMGVKEITNCGRCLSDHLNKEQAAAEMSQRGYTMVVGEQENS